MVQISLLLQINALHEMVDGCRSLLDGIFVADLLMHALDHGLGQRQPCALAFAHQLPLFGRVEQIQGLFVVVELGLAGGHIPKNIVDYGNSLEAVLVMQGGFRFQIFILLKRLSIVPLLHPLNSYIVLSLEAFLGKLLLESAHYRWLL